MLAITIVLSLQVDNNSQVFSSPPAGELEVLRRPLRPTAVIRWMGWELRFLIRLIGPTAAASAVPGTQAVRSPGPSLLVSLTRRPWGPGAQAAPCRNTRPSESCCMGRSPDLILTDGPGLIHCHWGLIHWVKHGWLQVARQTTPGRPAAATTSYDVVICNNDQVIRSNDQYIFIC